MKSPVKLALLAALPLELINFMLLARRYPDKLPVHLLPKLLTMQWIVFHWVGILALSAIYRMGSSLLWQMLAFIFCGYCETALLLMAVLCSVRAIRHRSRQHPPLHG